LKRDQIRKVFPFFHAFYKDILLDSETKVQSF